MFNAPEICSVASARVFVLFSCLGIPKLLSVPVNDLYITPAGAEVHLMILETHATQSALIVCNTISTDYMQPMGHLLCKHFHKMIMEVF